MLRAAADARASHAAASCCAAAGTAIEAVAAKTSVATGKKCRRRRAEALRPKRAMRTMLRSGHIAAGTTTAIIRASTSGYGHELRGSAAAARSTLHGDHADAGRQSLQRRGRRVFLV